MSEDTAEPSKSYDEAPGACLRCRGEMVEGWLLDMSHGAILQQRWIPGHLVRSWIGMPKLPPSNEQLLVVTYRCVRCGYLESYARRSA